MSETLSRFDRLLEIQRWAYRQKLDCSAKSVLCALAFHAGDKDALAWPSLKTLSEECSLHRTNVVKAIKRLEQKGLIHCRRRSRASTLYKCLVAERYQPSSGALPTLVAERYPNLSIKNLSIERGAKPKNGNGHGNGSHADTGGKVHLCRMCPVEHEWICSDEFDDASYELTCPNFRKKLKGSGAIHAKNQ